MNTKKFWSLVALTAGGFAMQFGCGGFNSFWKGFFNEGWPTNSREINILIDVLNEELFG
jgi:hypothetical protein